MYQETVLDSQTTWATNPEHIQPSPSIRLGRGELRIVRYTPYIGPKNLVPCGDYPGPLAR